MAEAVLADIFRVLEVIIGACSARQKFEERLLLTVSPNVPKEFVERQLQEGLSASEAKFACSSASFVRVGISHSNERRISSVASTLLKLVPNIVVRGARG